MKTILLIESNKSILENLIEYLEMENFKILAADNGEKGIELAREFIPDLIISGILFPEMNGYEIFHLLQDTAKTSEIPFIFSTTMSQKTDRMKALNIGVDDYIVKPYEMETLLQMTNSWIKSGSNRHTHLLS